MEEKTIAATSTPVGVGGISIIRMSGKDSKKILESIFSSHSKNFLAHGFMTLGIIKTNKFKEKCLCVYFKSPLSYTGEDVVEIQCHGGEKITEEILVELIDKGAVLAEPGEFTKRAFMNGKLSLDEAEGVIDIINAESESEIRAGYDLIEGGLKRAIDGMQKDLTDLLAKIEVSLDYPENDYEYETKNEIIIKTSKIKKEIGDLIKTSKTGLKLKTGIKVVILGNPNVGKSSLMNAMLNYDRSIVTKVSGTTRDILEENYLFNGIKFLLVDTAGIKNNAKSVEKIGVERALQSINTADVILFVLDGSLELSNSEKQIFNRINDKKYIIVVNKSDKKQSLDLKQFKNPMVISAKNGRNIEELKKRIYDEVFEGRVQSGTIITNTRHLSVLKDALRKAKIVLDNIEGESIDILSMELRDVWLTLGEITGETSNEKIIDTIFAKFCVGK